MADTWGPFLGALSYLESNNNPNAGNTRSSARGAFQFLNGTAREAQGMGIPNPQFGDYPTQAAATQQYIRKVRPQAAAAIDAGDYKTAIPMLNGIWPSLPGGSQQQNPARYQKFSSILGGGDFTPQAYAGGSGDQTLSGGPRAMPNLPPDALAAMMQQKAPNDWSGALQGAGAALAGITSPAQAAALQSGANQTLGRQLAQQQMNRLQVQVMPDGTIIGINPFSGQVVPLGKGATKLEQVKDQGILGNTTTHFANPFTGQSAPGTAPTQSGIDPTLRGPDAQAAIDKQFPEISNEVKSVAGYKLSPPTRGVGNRRSDAVMSMVEQVNPDYHAGYYKDIQDTNSDFGPKGQTGRRFVAMNNAAQHLGAASDLATSIDPQTNVVPWNSIAQAFGKDYQGKTGVTNFQTMANIAGTEVAKALHGVGSVGEKDEDTWRSYLSASQTPAQLQQRLDELGRAIKVQESSAYHAYEVGTHGVFKYSDQHPQPLVSPEADQAFGRISARADATRAPKGGSGTKYPGVRSIQVQQ